uniref:Tail protein n=1 Tax=viral metagenome TaxID=1070528 RepID=A0A6H1ZV23_9ZZZZ
MLDIGKVYEPPSSARYASPRRTGQYLPIVYGDMTVNADKGAWEAPCIDTASFIYAVAGSAVLSVGNGNSVSVYDKDEVLISPANYTFDESNNVESKGAIATITFTTSYYDSEPLLVKCMGRDSGGALITSPPAIIEDFIVNVLNESQNEIHAQSFAEVTRHCSTEGYVAGGIIAGQKRIGDVFSDIMGSFLGYWKVDSPTNRILLSLELGLSNYFESDIAAIIREHEMKDASLEMEDSDLCNQVSAKWGYNYYRREFEAADDGEDSANSYSQNIYGDTIRTFEWKWVRSNTVAATLQSRIVSEYGLPAKVISIPDLGFDRVAIETRDIVLFSVKHLYGDNLSPLYNQFGRVVGVRGDLNGRRIQLSIKDTGYYKTRAYLADGGGDDGESLVAKDGQFFETLSGDPIITLAAGGSARLADGTYLAGGERDLRTY